MSGLPNCYDCWVQAGQPHEKGCDVDRCLLTGEQFISCHAFDDDIHNCADGGDDIWTGYWPGEAECEEFGWWCQDHCYAGRGFVSCAVGAPGAMHDLNRLHREARWDAALGRWVRIDT